MEQRIGHMNMNELRWYGKQLHIQGTTNYNKYSSKNREVLEKDIRKRLELPPDEIILYDKPLKFLRDSLRKYGYKMSSDVCELMRPEMVRELVRSGFVSSDNELTRESQLVNETCY